MWDLRLTGCEEAGTVDSNQHHAMQNSAATTWCAVQQLVQKQQASKPSPPFRQSSPELLKPTTVALDSMIELSELCRPHMHAYGIAQMAEQECVLLATQQLATGSTPFIVKYRWIIWLLVSSANHLVCQLSCTHAEVHVSI